MTETVWEKIRKRAEDLRIASHSKKVISSEEKEQILKDRAKKISKNIFKEQSTDNILRVVSVVSNDRTYGIPINFVEEVFEVNQISLIPCLPTYLSGMVNYKGMAITVLNLKELFCSSKSLYEKDSEQKFVHGENTANHHKSKEKLIIIRNFEILAGIQIDSIGGLAEISQSEIRPLLSTHNKEGTIVFIKEARYKAKTIFIIDIEALFKDERLIVNMA